MVNIKNKYNQDIILYRIKYAVNTHPYPVFIIATMKFNGPMRPWIISKSKYNFFYFFEINSRYSFYLLLCRFFDKNCIFFAHFLFFSSVAKNFSASMPFSFLRFNMVRRSRRSSISCRYSFSGMIRYFFLSMVKVDIIINSFFKFKKIHPLHKEYLLIYS